MTPTTTEPSAAGHGPAAGRATMAGRRVLLGLVILALAVRLAALAVETHPYDLAGLSGPNGEMARNILVHGRWFVTNVNTPTAALQHQQRRLFDPAEIDYARADREPRFVPYRIQMPGPALLLAAVWWVTGEHRYLPLQLAQAFLDALAVLIVYWISRRLYRNRRAALLAAAGYAAFLPMAMLMRIPFYDPWAVLGTMAAFALFLWALEARVVWPRLVVVGAAVGGAMWFRPAVAVLPVALAVATIPRVGWRRATIHGLVPLVVALSLVAPYSLWTITDQGQFTPVNVGFGQVLWQGLGERPNRFGAVLDDGVTFDQVHAERPELAYATPSYDTHLRRKAFRVIAEHPGYYAELLAHRVPNALVPLSRSGRLARAHEALAGEGSLLARVRGQALEFSTVALAALAGPLLFGMAVAGLVLTWRRRRREHALLLASAAATFSVPIVLGVQWRYVAPATFVYLVLAGLAGDRILAAVAARSPGRDHARRRTTGNDRRGEL